MYSVSLVIQRDLLVNMGNSLITKFSSAPSSESIGFTTFDWNIPSMTSDGRKTSVKTIDVSAVLVLVVTNKTNEPTVCLPNNEDSNLANHSGGVGIQCYIDLKLSTDGHTLTMTQYRSGMWSMMPSSMTVLVFYGIG